MRKNGKYLFRLYYWVSSSIFFSSDPRVKDWLWMQSPLPTVSLILLYLLIVRYGPRIMKNRAPFEMKPFLFVFNSAITLLYIYLSKEVGAV